jgi:hypothetical protein
MGQDSSGNLAALVTHHTHTHSQEHHVMALCGLMWDFLQSNNCHSRGTHIQLSETKFLYQTKSMWGQYCPYAPPKHPSSLTYSLRFMICLVVCKPQSPHTYIFLCQLANYEIPI